MSAKDKQRLGIAIGLMVVVAAAVYFFVFRKPSAGPEAGPTVVGSKLPGARPAAAPAPAAPAPAGAPTAVAAVPPPAAAPAAPGAAPTGGVTPGPYRADPFVPLHPLPPYVRPPPPPPPLAIQVVGVLPVASGVLPPVEIAAAQRARQRMAGVLWNDHVWAIIETEEEKVAVVQPGDHVDDSMVRAISPQALVLASSTGRETEVRLQGRPIARAPVAPAAPSGPGAMPAVAAPVAGPPSTIFMLPGARETME